MRSERAESNYSLFILIFTYFNPLFFLCYSRDRNHVMHLLKRFPNMDRSTINAKYPNVDVEKLVRSGKTRGHFVY